LNRNEDIAMNLKTIKIAPVLIAASMFSMSEVALSAGFTDWATVNNVEAVERNYTIRKPVEKCWTETVRVTTPGPSDGSYTNELVGGLLGGVLGNQFGRGRGKDAMTIAGAALGASVANDSERARAGGKTGRYEEVERCETIYETEEKSELSHYLVTYSYGGHEFTTKMNRAPSDSMRIRVTVSPQ